MFGAFPQGKRIRPCKQSMQIKQQQRVATGRKSVFIDPNPRKEREMLDKYGNVINPKTKEIIRKAEENK